MNWRLAQQLRQRGYDGTSVRELDLANKSIKDGALCKALAGIIEVPFVLVAWDNKMHKSHRAQLDHFGITLAVVDKYADRGGLDEEQFYRDVIHRHVHRMETQHDRSTFAYTRAAGRRNLDPR